MECSLQHCNGEPTGLAAGRQSGQAGQTQVVIAVDAANLYWSDATPLSDAVGSPWNLFRCPIGGCGGEPTAVLPGVPLTFAASGGSVYWVDHQDIEGCSLSGCTSPRTLASGSAPFTGAIAADATSLYWTDGLGNLFRCAIAACGTTVETLLTNFRQGPHGCHWLLARSARSRGRRRYLCARSRSRPGAPAYLADALRPALDAARRDRLTPTPAHRAATLGYQASCDAVRSHPCRTPPLSCQAHPTGPESDA